MLVSVESYFSYLKTIDMKKLWLSAAGKCWMVLALCCMQLLAIAQDGTANTTTTTSPAGTTTTTTTWYLQPWVWVVGGILLLVILIALFRGGSSKDREVTRTTVIKTDRDI